MITYTLIITIMWDDCCDLIVTASALDCGADLIPNMITIKNIYQKLYDHPSVMGMKGIQLRSAFGRYTSLIPDLSTDPEYGINIYI